MNRRSVPAVVGMALGRRLTVTLFQRESTSAPVPDPVLTWDGRRMRIDIQTLPPAIIRALPPAFCQSEAKDWEWFVRLALAKGLL